jgi:hypothetical protein
MATSWICPTRSPEVLNTGAPLTLLAKIRGEEDADVIASLIIGSMIELQEPLEHADGADRSAPAPKDDGNSPQPELA